MTNPVEKMKKRLAEMTPGPWRAGGNERGYHRRYSAPAIYGADGMMVAETLAHAASSLKANAAGIVLSVNATRFLFSEAGVEAMARVIDPETWEAVAEAVERFGDCDNAAEVLAPSLAKARSILARVAEEAGKEA